MSSTNKTLRELKRFAQSIGLQFELLGKNKHCKIRLTRGDGESLLYVIPVSDGNSRNEKNRRADIRRFAGEKN